ncbi:tripartite tricarboxylate transporter substrate binding protein [Mitsuaria sp. GD03876]|uniref:Bug family tripartite tricarboxylate transporter substrate binding protein n=1 Tax=Mitsuaria sp. GD03876 TaxID=2975399 RepID=UPI0024468BC3|nr:tripartite tricarboxylate transporter substrate binding protein [Mitsuaria sp. GD03876]MDH0865971.1 tripartite tricarboxylate transporter substrate binding protein [Mitsuaria sp. GD03876]
MRRRALLGVATAAIAARIAAPGARVVAGLGGAAIAGGARAQAAASGAEPWPSRPIHLIVAYPPGGVSDETARGLAQFMSARLKVPVIVENRAGAGGLTALESLARAAPDGHALAYCAISPLVFAPGAPASATPPAARGDGPLRDIVPVVSIMDTPVLVLAHPSFKPRDFAATIAAARAAPGRLRWATSGHATVGHMVLAQVRAAAGVDIIHVPYKGGGQQLTDAIGGQFELLSSNVASQQLQFVRQGRLKALAIGSPVRLPVLPDVPTLAELGFPEANLVSTFGLFAPRGVPEERLRLINAVVNEALRQPEIRSKILDVSNLPTGGSAADFAARIAKERERALRVPAD